MHLVILKAFREMTFQCALKGLSVERRVSLREMRSIKSAVLVKASLRGQRASVSAERS